MRLNRFVALATGKSRRAIDGLISQQRVMINNHVAQLGEEVGASDVVKLDGKPVAPQVLITILFNKPVGFVCSRDGQGSKTIYDLLPAELHHLKPVGRIDKDSSGLLLLTNDGLLANQLTHPSYRKEKVYEVELNKALSPADKRRVEQGIELEDGTSRLSLSGEGQKLTVKMSEGRNRQIRRTFAAIGYTVTKLHRIQFGPYILNGIKPGHYQSYT